MKNAYIKFLTEDDRVACFEELSAMKQVMSLSDEIFCIPLQTLQALDARGIHYTYASSDEVTRTNLRTWRFAHP